MHPGHLYAYHTQEAPLRAAQLGCPQERGAPSGADSRGRHLQEVNGDEAAAAGEEGGRAELERLVADYHGLDAQDYVGGVACRFRYREARPAL